MSILHRSGGPETPEIARRNIRKASNALRRFGEHQPHQEISIAEYGLPDSAEAAKKRAVEERIALLQDGATVNVSYRVGVNGVFIRLFHGFQFPSLEGYPVVYDRIIFGSDEQPLDDMRLHLEGTEIARDPAASVAAADYLAARVLREVVEL